MEKFALLATRCQQQGWLSQENLYRPGKAKLELLEQAHSKDYLQRFIHNRQSPQELRRMGLPWSEGLVRRTLISPNGTFLTAQLALKNGIACHLAGGTHHAHHDFASGFCILNDLAITANALLAQKKVNKLLIFDCDVHQGDGTARILENEPRAITCSIHCEKNFPVRKAISDYDIGLKKGMTDEEYLAIVESTFLSIIEKDAPDFILYDAGVDIYKDDPLGLLAISERGIFERDYRVLEICKQRKLPVATVIGGGYDDDRLALSHRHSLVVEAAFAVYGCNLNSE